MLLYAALLTNVVLPHLSLFFFFVIVHASTVRDLQLTTKSCWCCGMYGLRITVI
jgi:hypothetical protein